MSREVCGSVCCRVRMAQDGRRVAQRTEETQAVEAVQEAVVAQKFVPEKVAGGDGSMRCRADSGTGNAKEASRGDTEGDLCVPSWEGSCDRRRMACS